jgi:hypothetical protein
MRRKMLLGALVLTTCCGCSTMNNTDKGVVGGGILGGLGGLAVGAATGNPGAGAAIGAGLGAVAGGATGAMVDNAERRTDEKIAQATATQVAMPAGPSLVEIVEMSQKGHPDSIIINHIRNSGAAYNLTIQDIDYLRSRGVSEAVVVELQTRPVRPVVVRPAPVVVHEPPPVVLIERRPPPGIYFRQRGCW